MLPGYNHNFRYRGTVFHVQTEDGGVRNPQIVTLLYHQGTILASKKTSYADIVRIDNLKKVVGDLMKEQHREMLRRLKNGELDEQIQTRTGKKPETSPPRSQSEASGAESPPESPPAEKGAPVDTQLDTFLLSYLMGDGRD